MSKPLPSPPLIPPCAPPYFFMVPLGGLVCNPGRTWCASLLFPVVGRVLPGSSVHPKETALAKEQRVEAGNAVL